MLLLLPFLPAGLAGLTRLRIARRPFLTDAQLAPLLAANRGSLLRLELAGCAALTDRALLHLLPLPPLSGRERLQLQPEPEAVQLAGPGQPVQPEQQQEEDERSTQPPLQQQPLAPLQHLQLVCCDRMAGSSLRQLPRLRSLRLSGCPAITEASLQVGGPAGCCGRLHIVQAWLLLLLATPH